MEKKFKLSVQERAVLMQILPPETDYLTYKIIRDLKTHLGFSEEDFKKFGMVHENKLLTWDKTKEELKEIPIGEKGLSIIIDSLKKLNEEKKINEVTGPLYERFVEK